MLLIPAAVIRGTIPIKGHIDNIICILYLHECIGCRAIHGLCMHLLYILYTLRELRIK